MPTTSRTARRRRCVWSARRRPTCSPRSPAASTRCGVRCTAAPTRPCWRCWRRSGRAATTSTTFVKKVKNREDGVKLMGFGHRVYKNYDPRARIVKEQADKILGKLGVRRRTARHRQATRRGRAHRRLLRRAQALPERRLLHRRDLPRDGLPDPDVHRAVRAGPAARAGSRTGARCTPSPARSAARARSTPATPSVITPRSTGADQSDSVRATCQTNSCSLTIVV